MYRVYIYIYKDSGAKANGYNEKKLKPFIFKYEGVSPYVFSYEQYNYTDYCRKVKPIICFRCNNAPGLLWAHRTFSVPAAEVTVGAVAALSGSEVDARTSAQLGVSDAACGTIFMFQLTGTTGNADFERHISRSLTMEMEMVYMCSPVLKQVVTISDPQKKGPFVR